MTEQPKYHCKRCARDGIANPLLSFTVHEERRRSRRALFWYALIAVVVAGVAVGCFFAAKAMFG